MRILNKLFAVTCVTCFNYADKSSNIGFQPASVHGTFIIVAKANDGIMMASDSRCSFPYKNEAGVRAELGYIDNFRKIFIIGKNAVAVAGNFSIDNLFISTMLEEFKKSIPENSIDIKSLIPSFFEFCKKHYSAFFYNKLLDETTIFAAGVDPNKNAHIFVYLSKIKRIQEQIGQPAVVETDSSSFVRDFIQNSNINTIQAGVFAEKAIKAYALKSKLSDRIGGNIVVAKITTTGVSFIQHPPAEMRYKYLRELINDIMNEKVKPTFTSLDNKRLFYKIFSRL